MKKFVRFAGVALLALTIGVIGCDDDAALVAPVAPPTPPPPPLEVTMSPASQTIGVGGTVVFAVSVSGGVAGATASWTCASSDTSKATVTIDPAGCAVTAVAAGGVSITAAVTKGAETVNAGAGLTILEDMAERASLFIASIKDSDGDDEVLSGRVNVTLSVELGDQMLTKLSVLVTGLWSIPWLLAVPRWWRGWWRRPRRANGRRSRPYTPSTCRLIRPTTIRSQVCRPT